MWTAIDDAERQLASLDFGPFILMGGMLARWITRPFVPFPEELDAKERETFFPHLFQARDEASALNLIDIQAMRMFEGWGARLIVEQTVDATLNHIRRARAALASLQEEAPLAPSLIAARLDLLACLLRNGRNAVAYQAQLDRMKTSIRTECSAPPPLGASASWDYLDLVNIARAEIDNTARMLDIIEAHQGAVIDMAPEAVPESIMRFAGTLPGHLKQKIRSMNAKWGDYARLSPPANP
jgi:hypothetical protein